MNLEQLRESLLKTKKDVEERLALPPSANLGESMRVEFSELSMVDNHPGDIASELFLRGMAVGDTVRDEAHLEDINQALAAMDDGTYGTCARCGQDIGMDRLTAMPTARYCIDCQRVEDVKTKQQHRPVEEEVLDPGFGAVFRDGEDQTAFDGEDAWQAVDRYNESQDGDHVYDQMETDDNTGIVDDMDSISNEEYKDQLPPSPTYRPED
jgi:DnaK suppressor protein